MTTPPAPAPPLERVLETALYVDDLARARAFYVDLLGCAVLLDTPRLLALSVSGASVLLLFQRGATHAALETPGGTVPGHGRGGRAAPRLRRGARGRGGVARAARGGGGCRSRAA
jgi:catechol 2,3-dioxygenase-like lactoylglutathione lyase family enzyme